MDEPGARLNVSIRRDYDPSEGRIVLTEKSLDDLTFEEAIKKLEDTIEKMEQKELSLEEMLNSFQEGIKLTHHCKNILTHAEKKIDMLLEDGTAVEYKKEESF